MPRYNIEYNNSTTLRREFPDDIGDVKAAKISIYDRGGTALLSSTAATVGGIGASPYLYTGVLTSAVTAGDYMVTLNASGPTLYPGDLVRIGGTYTAQDTLRVESYNSSTRVVTFSDYMRHDHAAGENVKLRFATYALDTTTVATWTSGLNLTIEWTFYADGAGTASPYMPYTDEGRILKRVSGEGGLDQAFRIRYRQYSELLQDDSVDFDTISDDALDELRDLFGARGLDIDKVVDSHAFYELRLAQMAYSLAFGAGDEWETKRTAISARRTELINLVAALPVWADTDQDLSEEDEEVQTYERPYPRRRLY